MSLLEEVKYSNHPGARGHAEDNAKEVMADVVTGGAFVITHGVFKRFNASAFSR